MQLHAASLGEAVPRENFNAEIQSVFDSTVNLRLVQEDRLITVLLSEYYELPQGIRIADQRLSLHSWAPLNTLRAGPGVGAAARGGILRFDCSPLIIDLRSARVWRCSVAEIHIDMELLIAQKAWSTAWGLLNKGQRLKSTDIIADELFQLDVGSPLGQRISKPMMQLINSTKQFDVQGSTQAAEKLIGVGLGVTPSGDDILIGFLAGLWSRAGHSPIQLSFVRLLGSEIIRIAKQTSEISRTYLYHAAQGQFSSSLSTLAEAIAKGNGVEHATHEAMRIGHSSGMDSVTGLLIGLCAWNAKTALTQASPIWRV
jgi:hypothetical protein